MHCGAPTNTYDGELIQALVGLTCFIFRFVRLPLVVDCILIEDQYGQKPPSARIQYADQRKQWTLQTAHRLREPRRAGDVDRSHGIIAAKSSNCGQRLNCGHALWCSPAQDVKRIARVQS